MKIYVRSDLDTRQITEKLTSYFGDEVDEMIKCDKKLQENIKENFSWKINSGAYVPYDKLPVILENLPKHIRIVGQFGTRDIMKQINEYITIKTETLSLKL
jgi:hypothetical protein